MEVLTLTAQLTRGIKLEAALYNSTEQITIEDTEPEHSRV